MILYISTVKKCYCEYRDGGKEDGKQIGIMCSTNGQWKREKACHSWKGDTDESYEDGEFCTGPYNSSSAVNHFMYRELCSKGIRS